MNELTTEQIAWLAGIYEGEGCCTFIGKAGFRIEIVMTDHDIIERIYKLVGIGTMRGPIQRGTNTPFKTWGCSSNEGAQFFEAIMPWLGNRRRERAEQAIKRWRENRAQCRPYDTHCIHGHEMTPDNIFPTYGGKGRGCRTCRRLAATKYNKKRRAK